MLCDTFSRNVSLGHSNNSPGRHSAVRPVLGVCPVPSCHLIRILCGTGALEGIQ